MSSTTTPDPQQYAALVQAQAATRAQVRDQAIAMATAAAAGFVGWYDTAAITDWATGLASRIEALQRVLARLTDAYMARTISMTAGKRVRPVGAVDIASLRGDGVTHAGAYARAADVYRWQQAQFDAIARSLLTGEPPARPADLVDPLDAAVRRLADVADLDTQLTVRAQEQANLTDGADRGLVTGWRRVIHPELSKGGTCGLCIAASDRLYSAREPRPIHARCECTVLPVLDHADPGSTLNDGDLGGLYHHAGGTGAAALKRTRYRVDEHGELGLVLNPAGAKVRTARDASRAGNKAPRQPLTDEQKLAKVRRIRDTLQKSAPKVQDLADGDPSAWGGYLTRLEQRIRDLDRQLAA